MIIYVVTAGEYSDYSVMALFTDREKALLFCAIHENIYEPYKIEEWKTEDDSLDSSTQVYERWGLWFDSVGSQIGPVTKTYTVDKPGKTEIKHVRKYMFGYPESFSVSIVLPIETPEDKVAKIARDAVAKWKYEHLVEAPDAE